MKYRDWQLMNKKKNKFIPELRFPEFAFDEGWEYANGDKLFETISNKNHNSDLPILAITQEHGAVPREMIDYHVSVTDKSIESYKIVEIGDFIISLRSFQGGIEYSKYLGLCSPAYIILRKRIDLDNDFYRHYFKSIPFIRDLNKNIEGIRDGKMVSYTQFSEIFIPKPNKTEQEKIASCLSSLDDIIMAHSQKLELLKDHKKGLTNNLFPQKGKKAPKYRFPEFQNDGDWAKVALEKITYNIMVGIASAATHAYRESGVVLFRNQNIKEGYLDDSDILYIDKEYEKAHKNKRLKAGDLLTARTGYPGTTCVVPDKYEGSQSFTTLIIRPNNNLIDSTFLCFYINSEQGQAFFDSEKIGGGQKNVNAGSLIEMPIQFPSINEQQKIVSCLSALDETITQQTNRIVQLKQHKKGLMQGLFPKVEK